MEFFAEYLEESIAEDVGTIDVHAYEDEIEISGSFSGGFILSLPASITDVRFLINSMNEELGE